jgi:hypothetical protein
LDINEAIVEVIALIHTKLQTNPESMDAIYAIPIEAIETKTESLYNPNIHEFNGKTLDER